MSLAAERSKFAFHPDTITHWLNGGKEKTDRRRKIRDMIQLDPAFDNSEKYFLSREELHKRNTGLVHHLIRKINQLGSKNSEDVEYLTDAVCDILPSRVHESMFIPTLASAEQQHWTDLARKYKIIGTYAQTELGHGTNIQALETTATFDPKTDQFVLNSPTLTSMKWWPGGLGKTSNFCVVMAKLILEGKDLGLHAFLVQIRSLEDHMPLPGITVGDIGPKMGFNAVDNGFLALNNVRIPRTQMLMRYSQVTSQGQYIAPKHAKVGYGTMVLVRATMVAQAYKSLSRACTIAIRYSYVRKQGSMEKDGPEVPIIEYQMQQHRLFTLLAACYALFCNGIQMKKLYFELQDRMKGGDFSLLGEVHATSAGLKCVTTQLVADGIEDCRKCCGGHGYTLSSGLVTLFGDYVPSCTFEGDNAVLLQQTAQYLIKAASQVPSGVLPMGSLDYLADLHILVAKGNDIHWGVNSESDITANAVTQALRHRALRMVATTLLQIKSQKSKASTPGLAWNNTVVGMHINHHNCIVDVVTSDVLRMARAHVQYILVRTFASTVEEIKDMHPAAKAALQRLVLLFGVNTMEQNAVDLLEDGFINQDQLRAVRSRSRALLSEIRPDALALVDAFDFSDYEVNSALGRYDGNVYEALYDWAKRSPLNKKEVLDSYAPFIKPLISSKL